MAGDTFTRTMFVWLNRIAADPAISPLGFKLAFIVGQHINRRTCDAWPTQKTLQKKVGASNRGVQKLLKTLQAQGHLTIIPGGGRRVSNRYRMAFGNQAPGSSGATTNAEPRFTFSPDEPRTDACKTPNGDPQKHRTPVRTEHIEEHIEGETPYPDPIPSDPQDGQKSLRPGDTTDAFDQFWRDYPRHIGRAAARRAFDRAVQSGAAPTEILAGARRYRLERASVVDAAERIRFTAYPTTWINREGWLDEPEMSTNGLVIDEDGNPAADYPPSRQSGRRTSAEIDRILGIEPEDGHDRLWSET